MEVVYVPKSMQIGLVPSVAPTSISAGSQTSSSAGQGSSSNAGAAAGGAVAAVVVVAAVVSYYVWKKRSMTVTEEEDIVDLETQKEPARKKVRRKDVEKMDDSGGKKKKNRRVDRDEVAKHTIDEDSSLELFYDDNQRISSVVKSPLSHNPSPRDMKSISPKSTLSSVSSPLPADASIDHIYGTDRLTAQSLQTFKSDRYASNRKKDLKEFGVFEVSKQRLPLSESPPNDGGSVISRQGSTKSNREGGSAVITNPENSLKAIFDMVIRGETGTISPDILHSNRKLYSSDRSGSDSSLESRSDSVGKVSLHSLADKTGESTVTMQVDTANL
jgi:hypothetical protein